MILPSNVYQMAVSSLRQCMIRASYTFLPATDVAWKPVIDDWRSQKTVEKRARLRGCVDSVGAAMSERHGQVLRSQANRLTLKLNTPDSD